MYIIIDKENDNVVVCNSEEQFSREFKHLMLDLSDIDDKYAGTIDYFEVYHVRANFYTGKELAEGFFNVKVIEEAEYGETYEY